MERITFKINGEPHSVGSEVRSDLTLLDYIREHAELRGTKYMCREGGCGACIVSAARGPDEHHCAVNSCLVSITSCQDWDITTIEKVGNKLDGYSRIQTTLAKENGTQCGYCSPGWVMSMYSLKQGKKQLTPLEIEKSFGSNICRCTGYRPILDAFKKFAKDPKEISDIEDLKICNKGQGGCNRNGEEEDWCLISEEEVGQYTQIDLKDNKKWFRVLTVADIFEILSKEGDDSYMLVAGNTAKGAYPILEYPRILIDISSVNELKGHTIDQNLIIGAGVTLTELLEIWKNTSKMEYFEYLQTFYEHLELVAHIAVRNLGSIAGNLMIKHQHNEFPSDLFLLFETVGANLTLINSQKEKRTVTMLQFLNTDMRSNVILNVLLPPLNSQNFIVTYKIIPRAQNVPAIVNAGFIYKLNKEHDTVIKARIVYGGLSPTFVRARKTENFLTGKSLFTNDTLQGAINCLNDELEVSEVPQYSEKYRKQLAINLFYKGLLQLCPASKVSPRHRSGAIKIKESRPVSSGIQIFDTDPTVWPVNEPVEKLEALIQCSGEAPYTEDLPSIPREVFAAFVLSTESSGEILSINADEALKYPGVIALYKAEDIPGVNCFTTPGTLFTPVIEKILAEKVILYYNQPVAIIVAEKRAIAERAAKLVKVKYINNIKKPVIDVKEAKKDPLRNIIGGVIPATDVGVKIKKVIKGQHAIYGQYNFSMETLVCVTKPIEEGLEVHAATQWADSLQHATALALNMDVNKVDVYVRRLGGAFGIKITRESQVAVACNIVAKKLNRPCRFIQSLTTNMRAVGKRFPCARDFEVGVDDKGEIQYVNYDVYEDNGCFLNEPLGLIGFDSFNNAYNKKRWTYKNFNTVTDTAKNSWCRAPGTLENIAMAELFMEQIAYETSLDPLEVRLVNLDDEKYGDFKELIENLKKTADYEKRRAAVNKFNKDNRWKKRGLRFSLSRWTPKGTQNYDITVSVYHGDGTVAIAHSGVEMGQGINTKAAQIAAYVLKIPLKKIQIKGNNTIMNPNGSSTGGSIASQNIGAGVQRACEELKKRLEPVTKGLTGDLSWEATVKAAYALDIDLQAHGFVNKQDTNKYDIYGVALAEVEIDVLTGQFEVLRVDITQDVGKSVSPNVDVGQIEGAFIMGLGYWTMEDLVYDKNTGELLTDRTWNYHVPQARDIPQDFRVYFRKNSYSSDRFFGSKAIGEPPICLSVVIPIALREAISEARLEAGIPTTKWFDIDGPYTVEKICLMSETQTDAFKF